MDIKLAADKLRLLGYRVSIISDTNLISIGDKGSVLCRILTDGSIGKSEIFESIEPCTSLGMAKFVKGNKCGILNFDLKILLSPEYDDIKFIDNNLVYCRYHQYSGIYDSELKQIGSGALLEVKGVYRAKDGVYLISFISSLGGNKVYMYNKDSCVCVKSGGSPYFLISAFPYLVLDIMKNNEAALLDLNTGENLVSKYARTNHDRAFFKIDGKAISVELMKKVF